MIKSKKADSDIITSTIIFVFLNLIIFGALFFFVLQTGTGVEIVEKSYARQIALAIDASKPGVELSFNLKELYEIAEENNVNEPIIVDSYSGKVTIKLSQKKGNSYNFFTKLNQGSDYVKLENQILYIKV